MGWELGLKYIGIRNWGLGKWRRTYYWESYWVWGAERWKYITWRGRIDAKHGWWTRKQLLGSTPNLSNWRIISSKCIWKSGALA